MVDSIVYHVLTVKLNMDNTNCKGPSNYIAFQRIFRVFNSNECYIGLIRNWVTFKYSSFTV